MRPPTKRLLSIVAALISGCQLFVASDEVQCRGDADCTGRGSVFAGTVCVDTICVSSADRCAGHVPDHPEDRAVPLHERFRVVDLGGTGVKGVPVLVCPPLDETCESPVGAPVPTDADGYAYVTLWKNFQGTVQIKSPPTTADYFKVKIHFLGAFETDDAPDRVIPVDAAVRLLTKTLFALQLNARGSLDANTGQILASAFDCDAKPRPDTHISISTTRSGSPILFYFTDGNLVAQDATATARAGVFGVANVPEGPITVTSATASGQKLGRVEVWVNEDTISNFSIQPTQSP